MEYAVEMSEVNKKIGDYQVLDNINLKVAKGSILGIEGRNASGKSMLFKAIAGLIKLDSGNINVMGHSNLSPQALNEIGVLIEYPGFLPNFSGYDNLKCLASIRGVISDIDIIEALEKVGLDPKDTRHFHKYSLGMRQKLGIAAAIMEHPRVLLLDEPFNNLDVESIKEIHNMLLELHSNNELTILLTSHSKDDIETLCTDLCKISNGRLLEVKK